jgi:hypothetical protein
MKTTLDVGFATDAVLGMRFGYERNALTCDLGNPFRGSRPAGVPQRRRKSITNPQAAATAIVIGQPTAARVTAVVFGPNNDRNVHRVAEFSEFLRKKTSLLMLNCFIIII